MAKKELSKEELKTLRQKKLREFDEFLNKRAENRRTQEGHGAYNGINPPEGR